MKLPHVFTALSLLLLASTTFAQPANPGIDPSHFVPGDKVLIFGNDFGTAATDQGFFTFAGGADLWESVNGESASDFDDDAVFPFLTFDINDRSATMYTDGTNESTVFPVGFGIGAQGATGTDSVNQFIDTNIRTDFTPVRPLFNQQPFDTDTDNSALGFANSSAETFSIVFDMSNMQDLTVSMAAQAQAGAAQQISWQIIGSSVAPIVTNLTANFSTLTLDFTGSDYDFIDGVSEVTLTGTFGTFTTPGTGVILDNVQGIAIYDPEQNALSAWETFWDGFLVGPMSETSWFYHTVFGNVWNDVATDENWTYHEMFGRGSDAWAFHFLGEGSTTSGVWLATLRWGWVYIPIGGANGWDVISENDFATTLQEGPIYISNPQDGLPNWRYMFQLDSNGLRQTWIVANGQFSFLSAVPVPGS